MANKNVKFDWFQALRHSCETSKFYKGRNSPPPYKFYWQTLHASASDFNIKIKLFLFHFVPLFKNSLPTSLSHFVLLFRIPFTLCCPTFRSFFFTLFFPNFVSVPQFLSHSSETPCLSVFVLFCLTFQKSLPLFLSRFSETPSSHFEEWDFRNPLPYFFPTFVQVLRDTFPSIFVSFCPTFQKYPSPILCPSF